MAFRPPQGFELTRQLLPGGRRPRVPDPDRPLGARCGHDGERGACFPKRLLSTTSVKAVADLCQWRSWAPKVKLRPGPVPHRCALPLIAVALAVLVVAPRRVSVPPRTRTSRPGGCTLRGEASAACRSTDAGLSGGLAGRVAVVPEARGRVVREPGANIGLDVPARSAGEFVLAELAADDAAAAAREAELRQAARIAARGRRRPGARAGSPAARRTGRPRGPPRRRRRPCPSRGGAPSAGRCGRGRPARGARRAPARSDRRYGSSDHTVSPRNGSTRGQSLRARA